MATRGGPKLPMESGNGYTPRFMATRAAQTGFGMGGHVPPHHGGVPKGGGGNNNRTHEKKKKGIRFMHCHIIAHIWYIEEKKCKSRSIHLCILIPNWKNF